MHAPHGEVLARAVRTEPGSGEGGGEGAGEGAGAGEGEGEGEGEGKAVSPACTPVLSACTPLEPAAATRCSNGASIAAGG